MIDDSAACALFRATVCALSVDAPVKQRIEDIRPVERTNAPAMLHGNFSLISADGKQRALVFDYDGEQSTLKHQQRASALVMLISAALTTQRAL